MTRISYFRLIAFFSLSFFVLQSCGDDSDSAYGGEEPRQNASNSPSYSRPNATSTASTEFDVSNSGASSYIFNSDDLTDAEDPDITLKRGVTYTFRIDSPGHPFNITSLQRFSAENIYNEGVDNNGTDSGTITFAVPTDAPDILYYICEFHSSMSGVFTIED